ncbi:NusB antitermination factor [Microlunatus sagamiharensis]|uniref:Transcription antitermination protein NusB n=1 Tax=Microlunatus sagamiharensis TaxID=546874 RepID=A0A1H2M790_9ACTN|nr:transcription antitermination factor NusB [Microlunatus sagamiharensis]SDU88818.1 NusB antitermination factor [Microlunatus sagamiharensis]
MSETQPQTSPEPASGRSSTRVSSRSKARKRALDILFESELRGRDPLETLAERAAEADPPLRDYTRTLVEGVADHRDAIDARISAALAKGWTLPRTPRVDRSALRIAVLEIDHLEVPDAVAVSEAVRLVADLSTDDSPSFVGGVLGAVVDSKPEPAPGLDDPA